MILRTKNGAGTHIYPRLKSGTTVEWDRERYCVFVPDGILEGGDWACSISDNEVGTVVIDTLEELAQMITALEIAYERAKQHKTIPVRKEQ